MSESNLRLSFRPPIPEIERAALLLDAAVTSHLAGHRADAEKLFHLANDDTVRAWLDSIWGAKSPYVQFREIPNSPPLIPKSQRAELRNLTSEQKRQIHLRDGYYCRFCGIPVIRADIRTAIHRAYPEAVPWTSINIECHAAFQAMWAQYDHILPHSRGGTNEPQNMILTCAACNYGRMDFTLEEAGLLDPRNRAPRQGDWDGLERFRA